MQSQTNPLFSSPGQVFCFCFFFVGQMKYILLAEKNVLATPYIRITERFQQFVADINFLTSRCTKVDRIKIFKALQEIFNMHCQYTCRMKRHITGTF